MQATPSRNTTFFSRVKQVFTGKDPEHIEAAKAELDAAIADLKKQAEAGKLSDKDLEERINMLMLESNGAA